MIYTVLATRKEQAGLKAYEIDNVLVCETNLYNRAVSACKWARDNGFINVRII
jgi:hypothetical protein